MIKLTNFDTKEPFWINPDIIGFMKHHTNSSLSTPKWTEIKDKYNNFAFYSLETPEEILELIKNISK
jgi:hypothetical protein